MDSHPTLTTIVYAVIAIVFISVVAYMVIYNLRQKARLKESGAHPQSVAGEIVVEKEQAKINDHR